MGKFLSYNDEVHKELALAALAASATPEDAIAWLEAEHGISCHPTTLENIVKYGREQYEELREKVRPLKEQALSHNLLDNAMYASEITMIGLATIAKRLEEDRIPTQYLSRTVRDLADVQAKAVDKKLSLEGRPSQVIEHRDAAEIIRALEQKRVIRQIEVTVDA